MVCEQDTMMGGTQRIAYPNLLRCSSPSKRYAPFSILRLGSSEIEQVAPDRVPTESAGIPCQFSSLADMACRYPNHSALLGSLLILMQVCILLTSSTSTFYSSSAVDTPSSSSARYIGTLSDIEFMLSQDSLGNKDPNHPLQYA